MKHFEDEYNKYLNENTPDLWDQIEAGITAGESAPDNWKVIEAAVDSREDKNDNSKTDKETTRRSKYWFMRGLVPAAAGFCILAAGMMTLTLRENSFKKETVSRSEGKEAVFENRAEEEAKSLAAEAPSYGADESAGELLFEEEAEAVSFDAFEEAASADAEENYVQGAAQGQNSAISQQNFAAPQQVAAAAEQEPAPESDAAIPEQDAAQEQSAASEQNTAISEQAAAALASEREAVPDEGQPEALSEKREVSGGISPEKMTTEEFVSHFSYDLPAPPAGQEINVSAQASLCPWNDEAVLLMIFLNTEPEDKAASNEKGQAGKEIRAVLDTRLSSGQGENYRCITSEDPEQLLSGITLGIGENGVIIYELQLPDAGNKEEPVADLKVTVEEPLSETGEQSSIILNDVRLTDTPDENFLLAAAAAELSLAARGDEASGATIENAVSLAETLEQNEAARKELLEFASELDQK